MTAPPIGLPLGVCTLYPLPIPSLQPSTETRAATTIQPDTGRYALFGFPPCSRALIGLTRHSPSRRRRGEGLSPERLDCARRFGLNRKTRPALRRWIRS